MEIWFLRRKHFFWFLGGGMFGTYIPALEMPTVVDRGWPGSGKRTPGGAPLPHSAWIPSSQRTLRAVQGVASGRRGTAGEGLVSRALEGWAGGRATDRRLLILDPRMKTPYPPRDPGATFLGPLLKILGGGVIFGFRRKFRTKNLNG